MPVRIRKEVVRIQREFLWGGVRGGKKVSWIKWSVVCKAKSKGGLGVRDVSLVNLSLLAKWRWRLLLPGRALWKDVLVAKYGDHIIHNVDWSGFRTPSSGSNWWKDICSLDSVLESKNWLVESVARKLGNGLSTSFWLTKWIGDAPLSVLFPRLFSLSNFRDSTVGDLCICHGDAWTWSFSWRRALFQWEEALVVLLRELLAPVTLSLEVEDKWSWVPDPDGVFSVKSAYNLLVEELWIEDDLDEDVAVIFDHIWESPAPSKVIAFSWQLLYDRIPTRSNLDVRGIFVSDAPWECVGCVGRVETSIHLFLHCPSAMMVWYDIFRWLGVVIVIPHSLFSLFEVLRGSARNAKVRQGFLLIWHATLWSIWKARNSSIFANGSFSPKEIVDEIKEVSWKWSLDRLKVAPSLFYEWTWDPGECLLR
ncbi:ribonuclease H protein [Trifolium medium]|uniref:Ribonuclease H protein n=1 Tax=Trifolium medium TaxID=97028 RepID=A0A392M5L8_9FABA|nr:ribonuclease H protein [Trifolium medium]